MLKNTFSDCIFSDSWSPSEVVRGPFIFHYQYVQKRFLLATSFGPNRQGKFADLIASRVLEFCASSNVSDLKMEFN